MKHSIALFLTVITLISTFSLSSCGLFMIENTVDDSRTDITADSEANPYESALESDLDDRKLVKISPTDYSAQAEEYLSAVSDSDFNGIAVMIDSASDIVLSPESAVTEKDIAKLKRNQQVEEKFNTTAIFTQSSVDDMLVKARESSLSGTAYCDLLVLPMYYLGIFESKGLLMNLNTLPFTDYSADYFYTEIIEQLTAGYDVFGVAGEACSLLEYSYGMYFNKELIERFGLDDPYTLVYNNSWTYDKMLEMCRIASDSLNGIEKVSDESSSDEKIYLTGIYGTKNLLCDIVYASTGDQYISTGFAQIPSASPNLDIAEKAVVILKNIFETEYSFYSAVSDVREDSKNCFSEGGILFFVDYVTDIDSYRDIKSNYGLVPMPKISASQTEYYTYCDILMPVFASLKTNINIDNTGRFLQAFNAASYGVEDQAYYNEITMNSIRDTDVLNMLDIIRSNYTASFAFAFCSAYSSIQNATFGAFRSAAQGGKSFTTAYNFSNSSLTYEMNRSFSMPN